MGHDKDAQEHHKDIPGPLGCTKHWLEVKDTLVEPAQGNSNKTKEPHDAKEPSPNWGTKKPLNESASMWATEGTTSAKEDKIQPRIPPISRKPLNVSVNHK